MYFISIFNSKYPTFLIKLFFDSYLDFLTDILLEPLENRLDISLTIES